MRLVAALLLWAAPVSADSILSATYTDPTSRYAHGVLGDAVEWGGLQIVTGVGIGKPGGLFTASRRLTWNITLPENQVFEDLTPRLWDITGDGDPEIVVVMTQADIGASLVVLGLVDGKPQQIAATPHIGRTNRWLAPVGAADLNNDGNIEVAYIDRPHLAKEMRIWSFQPTGFVEIATVAGLTNHRIGQDFIQSGQRTCDGETAFITADAGWTSVMATRFDGVGFVSQRIGDYAGPDSITDALTCP